MSGFPTEAFGNDRRLDGFPTEAFGNDKGNIDMRQERVNLTITVLTLICIGIVMIYSASCVNAMQTFGDSLYYLKRHVLFLTLGLVASFFILRMDYRQIQPHARVLIAICAVLLLLVL